MGRAIFSFFLAAIIGSAVFIPLMQGFPDLTAFAGNMVCPDGARLVHSISRASEVNAAVPSFGFSCTSNGGAIAPVNGFKAALAVWATIVLPLFFALMFLFRRRSSVNPVVNVSFGTPTQATINPAELQAQLSQLLSGGNVIGAIKVVRQFSNMGLKESKDLIEAMRAGTMSISEFANQPGSVVVSGQTAIGGETAAERLKKLDELKAQRLVTDEEYAAKRKEIHSSL